MVGIPIKRIATFLGLAVGSLAAATGIAIAVVEWRTDSVDLQPVHERLGKLETGLSPIDGRIAQLEGRVGKLSQDVDTLRSDVQALSPAVTASEPTLTPVVGSSRDNPVPLGQALLVPSGWQITVTNVPPGEEACGTSLASGNTSGLFRIQAVNVSAGDPGDFGLVSGGLVKSTGSFQSVPISCPGKESVFRGGTVVGVLSANLEPGGGFEPSLLLMVGQGEAARFFALG